MTIYKLFFAKKIEQILLKMKTQPTSPLLRSLSGDSSCSFGT